MKNTQLSNEKSYKKGCVEEMESLHRRMRRALIHFKNKCTGKQKKNTYGFKPGNSPKQQDER